ncbi:hypothetical protein [Saccharicrinis sp. FJH54]|uniref:hypothetical protein n=1 Tax=Saccharicrinis sp. FJH54 TaxID=3344665 RepID=UPI0035D40CFD
MKNLLPLFITVLILFSCENKLPVDSNSHEINRIDNMSFTDTVYEVTINSANEVEDTLNIKYIKKDDTGQVVFERLEALHPDFYSVNESYFKDGRLILRNTQLNGQPYSTYENFYTNDSVIVRSTMINYDGGRHDTFIINYTYSYYPDGISKTIKSYAKGDSTNTYQLSRYNERGKAVSGIFVTKGDTVQEMTYFYDNGKLTKSVLEFVGSNRKEVHFFNSQEKEVLRKYYTQINGKPVLTKERTWQFDKDGDLDESETKYMDKRVPERRKYIKKHGRKDM